MALINTQINPANFELVRDQIGAILKIELDNQAALWDNLELTGSFYVERFTPPDRSEGNVINVSLIRMELDNQTPVSQRNGASYCIDIYCNARETAQKDGCELSGAKLHRLAGLIRSIIQNPLFDKLGFTPGIIERRSIQQILFSEKDDNHDTINSRMGRVILRVDMHEESSGIQPFEASSYLTQVKLEATEKGYKFIYSNT